MSREYDLDDILNEFSSAPPISGRSEQRSDRSRKSSGNAPSGPVMHRDASSRPGISKAGPPDRPHPQIPAKKAHKKSRGFFLPLLIIAAVILLLGTAVKFGNFIFPNVFADSISLGGKTASQAETVLDQLKWNETVCAPLQISTFCGVSVEIDPVQAGYVLDSRSAAESALRYGRAGNIFQCLENFIQSFFRTTDIISMHKLPNQAYITRQIALCTEKVQAEFGDSLYRIDRENRELVIIKGYGTILITPELLRDQIVSALEDRQKELTFLPQFVDPVCPDMDAIHTLVCTGPVNARYTDDGTHMLCEGEPGYEFDLEQAKALWERAEFSEAVRIPLTVIEPDVTSEQLKEYMFHDLLGAVTTKYNNSNENRSSNVRLAASKINGTVLYPGEEFSFNDVVGVRTAEAGFLLAPAYAGYDDIKDEIGGGVCQVSTGVYAAALFSFLEITSHTCHVYPPNYIQLGTDTTVSIPEGGGRTIDFKFRNSKSCPIKIVAYCEEIEDRGDGRPLKTVTVEIWGTLEAEDFMPVEFDNSYSNIYDYDRIVDPPYPDREGYKLKFTHEETEFEDDYGSGIRTLTHRKVIDSRGNVVQDRIINRTYSAGYAMDTYYYKG